MASQPSPFDPHQSPKPNWPGGVLEVQRKDLKASLEAVGQSKANHGKDIGGGTVGWARLAARNDGLQGNVRFPCRHTLHGAFAPGRNEIPHLAMAGECDMMHLLPGCILTARRNSSETLRFRTGRGWLNRAGQGLDRPSRTALGRVGARPRPRRRSHEKTEKRDGKRRSADPRQPAVAHLRVP